MNKKLIIISLIVVMTLIIGIKPVTAESRRVFDEPTVVDGSAAGNSCDGLFTPEALEIIDELLGYFRILAPIVLILMIGVDFASAVIGGNEKEDAMKKATSRTIRRAIAAVLVFLVPTIVKAILQLDGVRDTIVSDPNCGLSSPRIVEYELYR